MAFFQQDHGDALLCQCQGCRDPHDAATYDHHVGFGGELIRGGDAFQCFGHNLVLLLVGRGRLRQPRRFYWLMLISSTSAWEAPRYAVTSISTL